MPNEEKFAEVTRKSKAKRAEMTARAEVQKAAERQTDANEEAARKAQDVADVTSKVIAQFGDDPKTEHD